MEMLSQMVKKDTFRRLMNTYFGSYLRRKSNIGKSRMYLNLVIDEKNTCEMIER